LGRLLVIDLGTTLYKFALFERTGELTDCVHIAPPVETTSNGKMELPVEKFLATVADGIRQVVEKSGSGAVSIDAITFSTQANSFVLLGANGEPLTPLVLWPDRRAVALESEIRARGDIPDFMKLTGIPRLNHQFMAAKLVWYAQSEPGIWSRVARIALISDYLTWWLTGQHITEAGTAGLSALIDIHRGDWHSQLVSRFELRMEWLPRIVRAGTSLGPIHSEVAKRLGLQPTCEFVVGCLDQYAGAIGVGNVEPGMVSETTGTVLATVTCCDTPLSVAGDGVFTGPAFCEGLFWRMVFGDVSGNILQWYRDQLPDKPDFTELSELAAKVPAGSEGLSLKTGVPLTGLAAVFAGVSPQHGRGHYVRSIMEGVANALDEQIQLLGDKVSTARPTEIRSAGGGAKSPVWLQIKADRIGVPLVTTTCVEPTSLGAAVLAEASLTDQSVAEVANRWIQLNPVRMPASLV
jgi:xylulokinase